MRDASVENLLINFSVLINGNFEPLGQRVDAGYADSVKSARNFVSAAAEFAAGVQFGKNDFDGRFTFLRNYARRYAAAVIDDFAASVFLDGNDDFVAISGKRLVDTVVDNLGNEMVQTSFVGRPDIHTRSFANGVKSFENLYGTLVVT